MKFESIVEPRKLDNAKANCLLSVVIIGRNEEDNISRCIEAALVAANTLSESYEIFYVDSASTDKSVAIASEYPITVIRIHPGEWVCAAAGRYIGTCHSNGEFVAFVDADMAVDPEWFLNGLKHLRQSTDRVGLVTGMRENRDKESGSLLRSIQEYETAKELNRFGASAIISKSALLDAGGFNPYLIACEEQDLSDRLLDAGYTLLGLPYKMNDHYGPAPTLRETLRRGNYGYYIGLGQYVRLLWARGRKRRAIFKIKVQLGYIVMCVALFIAIVLGLIIRNSLLLHMASLTMPIFCMIFAARVKSFRCGTILFLSQPFIIKGLYKGLLKPMNADPYSPITSTN